MSSGSCISASDVRDKCKICQVKHYLLNALKGLDEEHLALFVKFERRILVNTIVGVGFKDYTHEQEMLRYGLAESKGNQWSGIYPEWNKSALERLDTTELWKIFKLLH